MNNTIWRNFSKEEFNQQELTEGLEDNHQLVEDMPDTVKLCVATNVMSTKDAVYLSRQEEIKDGRVLIPILFDGIFDLYVVGGTFARLRLDGFDQSLDFIRLGREHVVREHVVRENILTLEGCNLEYPLFNSLYNKFVIETDGHTLHYKVAQVKNAHRSQYLLQSTSRSLLENGKRIEIDYDVTSGLRVSRFEII